MAPRRIHDRAVVIRAGAWYVLSVAVLTFTFGRDLFLPGTLRPAVSFPVAVIVLDAALSRWLMRRPQVDVRVPRTLARVGEPTIFEITLARPDARCVVRLRQPVNNGVDGVELATTAVQSAGSGRLVVVPTMRGVFTTVVVQLECLAPFGLVSSRASVHIELAEPLEIGPADRSIDPTVLDQRHLAVGAGVAPTRHVDDFPSGVREYRSGDSPRLIHWPNTARSGRLIVKDLLDDAEQTCAIVVDLGPTAGDVAEDVAGRARALALAVRQRGHHLILVTREPAGVVVDAATSDPDIDRRLARAVAGARLATSTTWRPGAPNEPCLLVDPDGVRWIASP